MLSVNHTSSIPSVQRAADIHVTGALPQHCADALGQILETIPMSEEAFVGKCVEAAVNHWRAHGRISMPLRLT